MAGEVMATPDVELFFDCSSPWTWLGFEALVEAAEADGFSVCFRPFLVGGVFNTVNPSVYEMRSRPVPAKARYMAKDLGDWARHRGLAIRWTPSIFPINSARAMRGCLYAADRSNVVPFARAVFAAYWQDDRDIRDDAVLSDCAAAAGFEAAELLAYADSAEAKERLKANTDELIARGGFGTPTFYVGGDDMYFGQDRVVLVREAVARSRAAIS
jgi:2-hydroxychromene-2-carboxylate isomerase